jgi:hypothetical protein
VIWANDIGVHSTKQGTLAVGEATSFWVRLRNSFAGDLSVTLTVSAP